MTKKQLEQNLPDGWVVKKLGDIAKINSKSLNEKTDKKYYFKYIDLSSVNKGRLSIPTQPIKFEDAPSRARRILSKNDVIMSTVRPYLQAFAIANFDIKNIICSTGFALISPNEKCNSIFIYQCLYTHYMANQYHVLLVGSNYPALNSSDINKLYIYLPPLPEQEKIAAILSTWDDAIDKYERLIEAKTQLKKGLMQILLTGKVRFKEFHGQKWEMVKIKDFFNIQIGGTPKRNDLTLWDVNKETNNRWLSISDLKSKFIENAKEYLSDKGIQKSNAKLIPKNTVVMSFKLTIGKRGILKKDFYTNEAICSFLHKDSNTITVEFLYQVISVINFDKEIDQAVKGKTLNKEKINRLTINLPPLLEQEKIASVLLNADRGIELLTDELNVIKTQKKGLMQKLLTGKIRVKV